MYIIYQGIRDVKHDSTLTWFIWICSNRPNRRILEQAINKTNNIRVFKKKYMHQREELVIHVKDLNFTLTYNHTFDGWIIRYAWWWAQIL